MSDEDPKSEDLYASYRVGEEEAQTDGGEREARWFARRFILRELEGAPKGAVLELGAGYGLVVDALQRLGCADVRGIDGSASQVSQALRRGVQVELIDGLSALRSEPEGSLSGIVALDVLEHLPLEECIEWMRLTRSRLVVGGRLIVRVPNGAGLFGPEVRWGDVTHRRAFTRSSLEQLFRLGGLTPLRFLPVRPPVFGLASGARHGAWRVIETALRVCYAAETGRRNGIFTRCLVAVAERREPKRS